MTTPDHESLSAEDERALWNLACRYASAVDRRDAAMFEELFAEDATMSCFYDLDAAPEWELAGLESIGSIPRRIRYDKTFHLLGNHRYWRDGLGTHGEVYGTASHLERSPHGVIVFVMHLRYLDDYVRSGGGSWVIQDRRLVVEWTQVAPANPAAFRRGDRVPDQ